MEAGLAWISALPWNCLGVVGFSNAWRITGLLVKDLHLRWCLHSNPSPHKQGFLKATGVLQDLIHVFRYDFVSASLSWVPFLIGDFIWSADECSVSSTENVTAPRRWGFRCRSKMGPWARQSRVLTHHCSPTSPACFPAGSQSSFTTPSPEQQPHVACWEMAVFWWPLGAPAWLRN